MTALRVYTMLLYVMTSLLLALVIWRVPRARFPTIWFLIWTVSGMLFQAAAIARSAGWLDIDPLFLNTFSQWVRVQGLATVAAVCIAVLQDGRHG